MGKEIKVAILMGSDSDWTTMEQGARILEEFKIAFEKRVLSAHRTPVETGAYLKALEARGVQAIICGAGMAAHLAGFAAAHTILPVIGVPLEGGVAGGLDALLSTVQMPGGIPVATMAVGVAGAKNAALFAIEILALEDGDVRKKLKAYRDKMRKTVLEKHERLQTHG
jgi:phosphoribosylaminoimidazole carboxylase PurE protein